MTSARTRAAIAPVRFKQRTRPVAGRRTKAPSRLEIEVERLGLNPRTMNALMDAATGRRVRNPVYRKDAAVSAQVAKRDLKLLVATGLLVPEGERRGRVYVASQLLKELWLACRVERRISDPFAAAQSQ